MRMRRPCFACRGDPTVSRFQGWKPTSVADAARFIAAQRDVDGWADDVVFALLAREWLAPERESD